jgi:aspartate carbamoyltransferase catalytic subunit
MSFFKWSRKLDNIFWGASEKSKLFVKNEFNEFLKKGNAHTKKICVKTNGFPKHIISSTHFSKEFLEHIYYLAKSLKNFHRGNPTYISNLCSEFSVLNYFQQASSRTFLSFSTAQSLLGIKKEEVRSIETSSFSKGESDIDSLRTISSYFDAIVCRHPSSYYHLFSAWVMSCSEREIPIVNAGCGTKEHPTQSLLDFFTIKESFAGELDGLTIGFVGDCLRGRTVHSLAKLLALFDDITLVFISPSELSIDEDTLNYIREISPGTKIIIKNDGIEKNLSSLDVVYMTRIQNEWGNKGSYPEDFRFKKNYLNKLSADSILMHPMPKKEEMDPALDFIKGDKRLVYWRQQRNGMWVRAALFSYLFGKSNQLENIN